MAGPDLMQGLQPAHAAVFASHLLSYSSLQVLLSLLPRGVNVLCATVTCQLYHSLPAMPAICCLKTHKVCLSARPSNALCLGSRRKCNGDRHKSLAQINRGAQGRAAGAACKLRANESEKQK